ncbi:hypothetical protein J3R30DRAFT_1795430 [Lentinula aciculospora]|uniref:Transmembrane protein n=1 Tax=Lentinula aciculospora TaxID=153920 RepID=A0A9W9DTF9_9AGAR|nr:hypothetical protein J3R30DRAFT_1795430 [Lentinula aciculospora]
MSAPSPCEIRDKQNGDLEMITPVRKKTQEDQDEADEQARRKALKDLVQSWQDRLQLITLLTTFLASVEASMLQVTMPDDPSNSSRWSQAANAGFMASLVLHLHASFISFFASFFLVRFKVQEAKREERQVEAADSSFQHVPTSKGSTILDMAAHNITRSPTSPRSNASIGNESPPNEKARPLSKPQISSIWSANPQLVQTGPFQRQPPINLLSRCHTLCLVATALGFILAMVGVLCYAWDGQSTTVAIITSTSICLCLLSCICIGLPQQSAPSSRLFMYH